MMMMMMISSKFNQSSTASGYRYLLCLIVSTLLLVVIPSSSVVHAQQQETADGFGHISTDVPQDLNAIQLGIYCGSDVVFGGQEVPTGIVTVESSSESDMIQILTNPPDLVSAFIEGGVLSPIPNNPSHLRRQPFKFLRLEYNIDVAIRIITNNSEEEQQAVGVKIVFPSNKLEGLLMYSDSRAFSLGQLIGNFPNLKQVEVGPGSQLYADFKGADVSNDLIVTAYGDYYSKTTNLYLTYEGGVLPYLSLYGSAYAEVTALKVLHVEIDDSANAMINVLAAPRGVIIDNSNGGGNNAAGSSSLTRQDNIGGIRSSNSGDDTPNESLFISIDGGCKRIATTNPGSCIDGANLHLTDVTAIVTDTSNLVFEGGNQICSSFDAGDATSSSYVSSSAANYYDSSPVHWCLLCAVGIVTAAVFSL